MDSGATAADLARVYGVSIRTIRRWAREGRWRRRRPRPGAPMLYSLDDVERLRLRHLARRARG